MHPDITTMEGRIPGATGFDFDLSALGYGSRIVVDGQDRSSGVAGVVVESYAGQPTRVTLHLLPGPAGAVAGEGIVRAETPDDMVEQLAVLLEGLDPADLERRALNSPELGTDEAAVTRQVLREAARLLRGRP